MMTDPDFDPLFYQKYSTFEKEWDLILFDESLLTSSR